MKSLIASFVAAAALSVVASGASAAGMIVTKEKVKGNQVVALDYQSDGRATALQLRFVVPEWAAGSVNLSNCAKSLPAGFGGQCAMAKNILTVLVYSDTNAKLPAGLLNLGTVAVQDLSKKGVAASFELKEALAFDPDGKALETTTSGDLK